MFSFGLVQSNDTDCRPCIPPKIHTSYPGSLGAPLGRRSEGQSSPCLSGASERGAGSPLRAPAAPHLDPGKCRRPSLRASLSTVDGFLGLTQSV